jgi:SEC-C motif-containing protein
MRSRYSAYSLGLADYLLETWYPSTRPHSLEVDPELRWYRLDILGRERGGMLDTDGTVEFEAHYRAGSERGSQRELSRFVRENGTWFYVDAAR